MYLYYGGVFILKRKNREQLLFISISAAMAALSVVFTRFLGFAPEGTPFRFEIGFLPIAIAAYAAGPIYAAGAYVTADVIGSFFSGYAPNLWITAAQLISGILMGIFFKRKHSFARVIICFSIIAVLVEVLIKSPVFVFMYAWTWGFTLSTRALNSLINLPIRILFYYFTLKAIKKPLDQLL